MRVPTALRGRVKQSLPGTDAACRPRAAGDRELSSRARPGTPELGKIIAILRQHAPELRERGVEHLYVFGSLVRGEAGPDSDIDLAIDVAPDADFSLLDLLDVQQTGSRICSAGRLDLVERKTLQAFRSTRRRTGSHQIF